MKYILSILVFVAGIAHGDSTIGKETKLEIIRHLLNSGSEGYRLVCAENAKQCELSKLRNNTNIKSVTVSRKVAVSLISAFEKSMKNGRRPASRGKSPLLVWKTSTNSGDRNGMVSEEEMEAGDYDRNTVLNFTGLEAKFISLMGKAPKAK